MQLFVGQDVDREPLGIEPVGDVRIGVELPELRLPEAAEARLRLGTHLHDGAHARRIANAAAVGVGIVKRAAVFPVRIEKQVRAVSGR